MNGKRLIQVALNGDLDIAVENAEPADVSDLVYGWDEAAVKREENRRIVAQREHVKLNKGENLPRHKWIR